MSSSEDDTDVEEDKNTSRVDPHITVQDLRTDERLQRKVCDRLQNLSSKTTECQDHTHKGKRSGRNKTVHDVVRHDVEWPQYHVNRTLAHQNSLTFDELTLPEFVAGTLTAILNSDDKVPTLVKLQIRHLIELMSDAGDFTWPVLRQFQGILLQDMEMGRYSWGDTRKIQKQKMKHVARAELVARARPQTVQIGTRNQPTTQNRDSRATLPTQNDTPPILCKAFNQGECQIPSPHITPEGLARHCCSYCSCTVGKLCTHAEKYCRRRTDTPHPYQNQLQGNQGQNSKNL